MQKSGYSSLWILEVKIYSGKNPILLKKNRVLKCLVKIKILCGKGGPATLMCYAGFLFLYVTQVQINR